ncbi:MULTISPECIES: transporter substrate-binding domain-containing protein [unclassified Mesorhizobium]|uniref:transporter substrate-binding domain-containing protein n=1 Tax=unclassified Mesorhizobium TaxID=325217 RepID=UPI002414FE9A|nr:MULTISPECIES: transporter substrate-binding domain-containing protein [unclassified Mesorhizobium]MDG4889939.1 transporter substrate-binding domain-containing protein [Mesorhizobium sp. WSM4887]MDG4904082.1 transporter substrate-binding domain-containing protein [Mesorhizobium sp. WSM4962]MDG4909109.1 transporter substrate-binding domain-containing protein [Mesorhizobium sp. WSM4898]MDG4921733.1 transporter substrate-binding domain-containing protein [Mesorhizobium sp. WSM4989]
MRNLQKLGRRSFLAATLALSASIAWSAGVRHANAATVDEIKQKGTITFGIVTDQPPFSFINANGENEGYDIDITKLMAKELGVKVAYVPITSANRIPQLLTGKVDMLICVMGVYPDRAKVVQYVAPYASINAAIYGPKDSPLSKVEELSGHSIAVEKGSSMDKAVSDAAPKDANVQKFDDASSAVQALLSGQVEYLGSYSHQFGGVEKAAPGKYAQKIVLSTEYEGIAVSPQSKELGEWAGQFWDKIKKDGTLDKLYQDHFGTKFPDMPATMDGITFTAK